MGHEALGRWLSEEIGTDPLRLNEVLVAIERLAAGTWHQWRLEGQELSLELSREEAWIEANALRLPADPVTETQELTLYDQESVCGCGLEDFSKVLFAWQAFLFEDVD